MTHDKMLIELEQLASKSGITVRYEKGDFDGGYCVLKNEKLIVINRRFSPAKRASVLAQGLAEVGINEIYLKPAVREFIEDELERASRK